jgi:hypothetical protein
MRRRWCTQHIYISRCPQRARHARSISHGANCTNTSWGSRISMHRRLSAQTSEVTPSCCARHGRDVGRVHDCARLRFPQSRGSECQAPSPHVRFVAADRGNLNPASSARLSVRMPVCALEVVLRDWSADALFGHSAPFAGRYFGRRARCHSLVATPRDRLAGNGDVFEAPAAASCTGAMVCCCGRALASEARLWQE